MKHEYCCKCDCETGNAGVGDGSLYLDNGDGPFCDECYEKYNASGESEENGD